LWLIGFGVDSKGLITHCTEVQKTLTTTKQIERLRRTLGEAPTEAEEALVSLVNENVPRHCYVKMSARYVVHGDGTARSLAMTQGWAGKAGLGRRYTVILIY